MNIEDIDVAIIGGGPAGLTAGMYLARARIKTSIFEKNVIGGQVLLTYKVENYPGYPEGISGVELIEKMKEQAINFGLTINNMEVIGIRINDKYKEVEADGKNFYVKSIVIATGTSPKKLNIPGEEEFIGRGVSYCATCDAAFYKEKDVAVIGGGDSAVEEAIFLSKFANRVILIHRRRQLRATKILQERLFSNKKIEFLPASIVTEIKGKDKVELIVIKNVETGVEEVVKLDGLFVAIGTTPQTDFLKNIIKLDDYGYIITTSEMETSVKGVFACGDCIRKSLRQIITACGEGATAAFSVIKYLEDTRK